MNGEQYQAEMLRQTRADNDRQRAINAELLELLSDIEKHLSGGAAVRPGSLIFAEDKAAIDVIRAAIAKEGEA